MAVYCILLSTRRVIFSLYFFMGIISCQEPIPYGNRYSHRDGVYATPNIGKGYQTETYIYKDRRYGNPTIYLDPIQRVHATIPDDQMFYKEVTPRIPLPGILGGWRQDLQGKERPDSKHYERNIYVNTNYGQVQGFKVELYDNPTSEHKFLNPTQKVIQTVDVFLGIPYAMPPIKEGRFKPPRPHREWQQIQAVDWGPACPQPSKYTGATKGVRDVDEDCLYLNIFSPNTKSGLAEPYPVMFYIHGGEFTHGSSNLFPAHMLAAFYNVVVVSINYRLGALGFLSTGDENSPGNYGILDQAMALKWVYNNIKSFNGNPDSITLFGSGAGAASAGLLMLAPSTHRMVSKVIAQSGSALAEWAVIMDKYRAQNTSRVFAKTLGCGIESNWKLVECLYSRTFYKLANVELKPDIGMFPWAPVFDANFRVPRDNWYDHWKASDWRFFVETPEESIKAGRFNTYLSYMSGVTTQEAAYILHRNTTLAENQYEINSEMFNQKLWELVLRYNYTLNPLGVYEAIKYMYTYWPDPKNIERIREQYINLLSDFHYVAPFDKMAKLLVEKHSPVYLYVLNTTVESLHLPQWRRVSHETELLWLTGAPFMDTEFFPEAWKLTRDQWTEGDRNMSHFFMQAYSNFATYGNPTPAQIRGLYFNTAKEGELQYLNINTTLNSSILFNYRQIESAFWSNYLPTVIGRLLPKYPPDLEYWDTRQSLQIAFWSMSVTSLLLIVLSVVCCMLWRNAKRQSDHYYSGDILMVRDEEHMQGIENISRTSKENLYEYRDTPPVKTRTPRQNEIKLQERLAQNRKFSSTPSLRSSSNVSLKNMHNEGFITSSPNGQPKMNKALSQSTITKSKTHLVQGVPQTAV